LAERGLRWAEAYELELKLIQFSGHLGEELKNLGVSRLHFEERLEKSLGEYGAPFFFVPKPNGRGLRAVCDYRAINSITRKVLPSLPLFENIISQLEGAQYFSGLDLTSQFYQIRVEQRDVQKTAFRSCYGLYNWTVTPMGMTVSVGTAMNCMQQVLQHVVTTDGEELALLYALKSFRHFLLRREFDVQTDNAALSQIFTSKNLSDFYARWYHKIAEFEGIRIKHWPGCRLHCANVLSRRRPCAVDDLSPFQVEATVQCVPRRLPATSSPHH